MDPAILYNPEQMVIKLINCSLSIILLEGHALYEKLLGTYVQCKIDIFTTLQIQQIYCGVGAGIGPDEGFC